MLGSVARLAVSSLQSEVAVLCLVLTPLQSLEADRMTISYPCCGTLLQVADQFCMT